jgi:mono/diheme cytochrome c family protein
MKYGWIGMLICLMPPVFAADEQTGAAIFERHCATCHARGDGHPGTQSLAKIYGGEQASLLDRVNLPAELVRFTVRNGRGLMPGFRVSEIDNQDLKLLIEFLNDGRDIAQPEPP